MEGLTCPGALTQFLKFSNETVLTSPCWLLMLCGSPTPPTCIACAPSPTSRPQQSSFGHPTFAREGASCCPLPACQSEVLVASAALLVWNFRNHVSRSDELAQFWIHPILTDLQPQTSGTRGRTAPWRTGAHNRGKRAPGVVENNACGWLLPNKLGLPGFSGRVLVSNSSH